MTDLARLVVKMEAENAKLLKQLDQTNQRLNKWEKSTVSSIDKVKTAFIALGGVALATQFARMAKEALNVADGIAKAADTVALSTDAYQELAHAAELAGIEQSQFNSNMTAFVKRVGEARSETGPLVSFLKKYDQQLLSAIQQTQTQEQAFNLMSDAIKNAATETDRAALANAAFSRAGVQMTLFMKDGSKGLEEMRKRARDLGVVLDEEVIRNSEVANDKLEEMSKVIRMKLVSALADNAESIGKFADSIIDLISWIGKAITRLNDFGEALGKNIATLTGSGEANRIEKLALSISMLEQTIATREKFGFLYPDGLRRIDEKNLAAMKANLDKMIAERTAAGLSNPLEESAKKEAEKTRSPAMGRTAPTLIVDQDRLQKELDALARGLLSAEQLEEIHYQESLETLRTAQELRLETLKPYEDLEADLKQQHMDKLAEIEAQHWEDVKRLRENSMTDLQRFTAMSFKQQTQTVLGELINMTQGVAQHSKTMFRINKIASIANAVINTSEGVTKALSAYPPPLSFAMAAAQLAAGIAQVNTIRATSFGGATAPSLSAAGPIGTPTNPITVAPDDQTQSRGTTTIQIIADNIYGVDHLQQLIVESVQQAADNDVILIDSRTRNGLELAG